LHHSAANCYAAALLGKLPPQLCEGRHAIWSEKEISHLEWLRDRRRIGEKKRRGQQDEHVSNRETGAADEGRG
jgi:hypothetical protein